MKLRKIKLFSSKLGYEVNIEKTIDTYVMDNFGNLLSKKTILIDKDPRGNWLFRPKGKNRYSEFVLEETTDWVNKTPSEVSESIKAMSPDIVKKYGPNVGYVTLEEALMAFLKDMKAFIRLGEFSIVCEPGVVDVVKLLVDNGWPLSRVENKELLNTPVKTKALSEEVPVDEPEELPVDEPEIVPPNGEPVVEESTTSIAVSNKKRTAKAREAVEKARKAIRPKGEAIAA